jgi:hypothetical protein|tara:strand:- start:427 stop:711 length:285 start_codon:yes stop_codon:yes gene_type:complete
MTWTDIDKTSLDSQGANNQNAERRREAAELAQAYHRTFQSKDGERVLEDLTKRFLWNNDTSFGSDNVNYEAAYHNGETGVVKFIANQLQQAEIL